MTLRGTKSKIELTADVCHTESQVEELEPRRESEAVDKGGGCKGGGQRHAARLGGSGMGPAHPVLCLPVHWLKSKRKSISNTLYNPPARAPGPSGGRGGDGGVQSMTNVKALEIFQYGFRDLGETRARRARRRLTPPHLLVIQGTAVSCKGGAVSPDSSPPHQPHTHVYSCNIPHLRTHTRSAPPAAGTTTR